MAGLTDAQIAAQNPWWSGSGWEQRDPHIRELDRQPRRIPAPLVEAIDLTRPGIHTLRGPRQVGKSTDLKLIVQRALASRDYDERDVIYLAMDVLEGRPAAEMATSIARAKRLARAGKRSLLLLDEVTFVPAWRAAVKFLWDQGELREDVVICTGSSAIDLRSGAERMPGRRGAGRDHGVWPLAFSGFATALNDLLPSAPGLAIADLASEPGREVCRDARLHLPALQEALDLYLRFGGLPAAVAEAADGAPEPSDRTRGILYDSLLKELSLRGAGAAVAHKLGERLVRSLGSKLSWSSLARDLDKSHTTAREYVEHLARAYLTLPLYFWRRDSHSSDLSKDKKLYFGDPLLHRVALEHAPGLAEDRAAMVENAVALAALQRYEPQEWLVEGFDAIERLHVWGTRTGGEVDFVCGPYGDLAALEVKHRERIDRRSIQGILKALPGRPLIVATKETLEYHERYALVPSALVLWALGGPA